MAFIIACIFWILGLVLASFTLIPILIILVFGIPITRKLEKLQALKPKNGIVKGYLISMIILPIVYLAVLYLTWRFVPNGLVAFLIGTGMTFLFGLGQIGKNKNNVADYMETNQRHLNVSPEEALRIIIHS